MLRHAIQEVGAQVFDRLAHGIRIVQAVVGCVAPSNADYRNVGLLGAANVPDRVADDDGSGDVGAALLQARQGIVNDGCFARCRVRGRPCDHIKNTGQAEM